MIQEEGCDCFVEIRALTGSYEFTKNDNNHHFFYDIHHASCRRPRGQQQ